MNLFIKILIILTIPIISYLSIQQWNLAQIEPSIYEIDLLEKNLGSISIKNPTDLIKIQNKVLNTIRHEFCSSNEISMDTILKYKKGFCFDRSMILQKICLHNNLEIRPVFLYFNLNQSGATIFNLFDKNLQTHNIFEVKMNGKWYMVQTNHKQDKLKTLEEYLASGISVPTNTKYIRHLNNRNGRFIAPSFIPDIY